MVSHLLHLWLILITFMVGITFILHLWLLSHLWVIHPPTPKLEDQFTGSENINFCRVQYHSEIFCSSQSITVSGRHLEVGVKKKFARKTPNN